MSSKGAPRQQPGSWHPLFVHGRERPRIPKQVEGRRLDRDVSLRSRDRILREHHVTPRPLWTVPRLRACILPCMRVLVVEDSPPTRDLLSRSLREAGIDVTCASRIGTGFEKATQHDFDVIVLDLMLPDGDGLSLCRELRVLGVETPILCVTARVEVSDRVAGLDAGADDYLRKPFALAELHARVRALARRRKAKLPTTVE